MVVPTSFLALSIGFFYSIVVLSSPILERAVPTNPAKAQDFPDPSVILVDGIWYAFATQGGGHHVQSATSQNFASGWTVSTVDVMPTLPAWVDSSNPAVWAPDVLQLPNGQFILYFTALTAVNPSAGVKTNEHCVGAAISNSSVAGPYIPQANFLACPIGLPGEIPDQGGAIDPAGFIDTDGSIYFVYKIDGNSKGGGGPCGNNDEENSTPIMLQQVGADGTTLINNPVQILDRDASDGPLIEAPSLNFKDGTYYLFFSSNCFNTPLYDTSYATATSVTGPYTKAKAPLLTTGNSGHVAPGGADVTPDGTRIAFHANAPSGSSGRWMYTANITEQGGIVSI